MSRTGFVLLTHNKPYQMLRLVTRLNTMFDEPPIVCHHDFAKCPLPEGFLPANVEFVRPHVVTEWGKFSLVEAMLRALEQMYRRDDSPDWCVTLSGSCYPTKPAAQILANLNTGGYDIHIDGLDLNPNLLPSRMHKIYYSRYCVKNLEIPSLDKRLRPRTRRFKVPQALTQRLLPYHDGLRPFAGSQWFTVSRHAAQYIFAFQNTPDGLALVRYYRKILFSDESFFQTVVYNTPDLKINPDNWLYLDWSEMEYHPKTLTLDDLPALQASPTHFARKIDADSAAGAALLDALDQIIDGSAAEQSGTARTAQLLQ